MELKPPNWFKSRCWIIKHTHWHKDQAASKTCLLSLWISLCPAWQWQALWGHQQKKRETNCKEIIKQKVSFKGVFYSVRAAGPTGVIWFALGRPTRDPKCGFRGLFTVAPAAEHKTGGGSIELDSSVASIIMAFTESCARAVAVASCDRVCLALRGAAEETLARVSWSGQAERAESKSPVLVHVVTAEVVSSGVQILR